MAGGPEWCHGPGVGALLCSNGHRRARATLVAAEALPQEGVAGIAVVVKRRLGGSCDRHRSCSEQGHDVRSAGAQVPSATKALPCKDLAAVTPVMR